MSVGRASRSVLLLTLIPLILFSACSRAPSNEGIGTIEEFARAIKAGDSEALKRIVSPSGLVVIRGFCSGYGTRGKRVRTTYSADDIPVSLQFAVTGETPIDLDWLFEQSQEVDVGKLKVRDGGDDCFAFKDTGKSRIYEPTTDDVWGICDGLPIPTSGKAQGSPVIFNLDDQEVVLGESMGSDIPVGAYAVFESLDGRFYLRAILDLR